MQAYARYDAEQAGDTAAQLPKAVAIPLLETELHTLHDIERNVEREANYSAGPASALA
jgi:hypothetical protein